MLTSTLDSSRSITSTLRSAGCVFAEDEARLLIGAAQNPTQLAELVRRRVAGMPLEYLVGWAEFAGLRIAVQPGVFVPRRRTEFLARQAADLVVQACQGHLPADQARAVVVDLCCGSGAVGAKLLAAASAIELHAVDFEPTAVRCARANLAGAARVYAGDLYQPLPASLRGRINVLVANAPYVPTDAIELLPAEARKYEPTVALDGGADGLEVQRRIAAGATRWLAPGGHLLVETSDRQASQSADIFASNGLVPRVSRCEDLTATVVIGTVAAR